MKKSEWEKNQKKGNWPDALRGNPIICPVCGHIIGYTKDYEYMVIPDPGIVCPNCDEIVVWNTIITMRA